jgi:hypothetical protein
MEAEMLESARSRAVTDRRFVSIVLMSLVLVASPVVATVLGLAPSPEASAATKKARWASCPSVGFYPASSSQPYSDQSGKRTGQGWLRCALTLPHRAKITAVRFVLWDGSGTGSVNDCTVVRSSLRDSAGQFVVDPVSTGAAFADGFVRLTRTSIDRPVVNNRYWSYHAQCFLTLHDSALGIEGMAVRYTPN